MDMVTTEVDGMRLAARRAGDAADPAVVLLHGWPQSSRAFEGVVDDLGADHLVLAFDLPGIGDSTGSPSSAEKTVLANLVLRGAEALGAHDVIVAGYDVGGMVAFAAARDHGSRIVGAMVMNTVIPGIHPWEEVVADPRIFHFALHALPELPEILIAGRERAYFDVFYEMMAGDSTALTDDARQSYVDAYSRPGALTAGFDWYRAMPADAEHNRPTPISVPMLYVRGDADGRTPDEYVRALREFGVQSIDGVVIPGGEYVAEERPQELVETLRRFRRLVRSTKA